MLDPRSGAEKSDQEGNKFKGAHFPPSANGPCVEILRKDLSDEM